MKELYSVRIFYIENKQRLLTQIEKCIPLKTRPWKTSLDILTIAVELQNIPVILWRDWLHKYMFYQSSSRQV